MGTHVLWARDAEVAHTRYLVDFRLSVIYRAKLMNFEPVPDVARGQILNDLTLTRFYGVRSQLLVFSRHLTGGRGVVPFWAHVRSRFLVA